MAIPKVRKTQEFPEEFFAAEEQVFHRKREHLLRRYEGQFVALYQGRVVGHSKDDEELAKQMFEKLGDARFYIVKVEKEPTIYDLPSPEAVR
jgi:Family of unknown function (DUF5678)